MEPDFIVSLAPELLALSDPLRRELPEAEVVVGHAGSTAISVITAADPSTTAELAARFPLTALFVVNPRGNTPPREITAHLEAGAAGFLDGSAAELVAAHISAIARRQAQVVSPRCSKQTPRSF